MPARSFSPSLPLAPLRALVVAAVLTALVAVAMVWLAVRDPVLGVQIEPALEGAGLRVVAVAPGTPAASVLSAGDRLVALHDTDGRLALTPALAIAEPDQLGSWAAYNGFMRAQSRIEAALESGSVRLERADGTRVPVAAIERRWQDLPGAFWFQVAVGAIGFMLAAGVWAFRQRHRPAVFFLAAGLGMFVFASAAAVYSTRELAMAGGQIRALSMSNHFGAQFFTASLLALLWNYPRRLARFPLDALGYVIAGVACTAEVFELTPNITFSYVVTLGLFAPSFVLAGVQWRRTRGRPVERAALKWFLLSIYIGTGLFAAVVLLPVALGIAPFASQGMMFVVFLIMFAGIALGITRYRLFDLDLWWFFAWSWFLGGLAVIAVDLALVGLLDLTRVGALTGAIAVIGWVYFPLRQWVWGRLYGGADARRDQLAARIQRLFTATSEEELSGVWRAVLDDVFRPLEVAPAAAVDAPALEDHGQALRVPALGGDVGLRLAYSARGQRLFNREDVATATFLWRTAERARQALLARETAIGEERSRIMRDLHDDLGAKLVSLVHLPPGEEPQPLARAALQDMREILSALEAQPCPLEEAAAVWRAEAETRAERSGIALDWNGDGLPERMLSARQRNNLGRILREALTNAIRHADASRVAVHLTSHDDVLTLAVSDDGVTAGDPSTWHAGLGIRVVSTRADDLGGSATWLPADTGGTLLRVRMPFDRMARASS